MKKRASIPFALLLFALGAQAAFAEKALSVCVEAFPVSLSPRMANSSSELGIGGNMFDSLVAGQAGANSYEEALAADWFVSQDGTRFTIQLRQNVPFHSNAYFTPTRTMNADDVVFTYTRNTDETHPYFNVLKEKFGVDGQVSSEHKIESVRKIDQYTVEFTLYEPDFGFMLLTSGIRSSIYSAEYAEKMMAEGRPEFIELYPIGTDKFQLDNIVDGEKVEFVAFAEAWAGPPKLDRLVFHSITDAHKRWEMLEKGECDVAYLPSPDDYPDIVQDENIKVFSYLSMNVAYLAYNTFQPPFDNVEVRRALNMAVDRDRIVEEVYLGFGQKAKSFLPPETFGHHFGLEDDPYDPKLAQEILKAQGITTLETNLWTMPVQRPYNPNPDLMAKLIAEDWAKIGVNATVKTSDWAEYPKIAGDPERQGPLIFGWGSTSNDPAEMAFILQCEHIGRFNFANWCNKEMQKNLDLSVATEDASAQLMHYQRAQEIFKADAPWMTIAHALQHIPMRKEVSALDEHALSALDFREVDLVEEDRPSP